VNARRAPDAHEPSHEAEKPSAHVRATAAEKDVYCFGTTAQNVSDLHVTRNLVHRCLLAERTAITKDRSEAQRSIVSAISAYRRPVPLGLLSARGAHGRLVTASA
jgi:hypothetical protein